MLHPDDDIAAPRRRTPPDEPTGTLDIGFAAERPVVSFGAMRVERTVSGSPSIRLRLSRAPRPPKGAPAFAPFRLPERVEAFLDSVGVSLLKRLRATLTVAFEPGWHSFPLAKGDPVLFEFGPQTGARVDVEVLPEDDGDGREVPVIQRLDLVFDRPVVLHNVLHALNEVRSLFEDHALGAVLRSAPVQMAWRRITAAMPQRLRDLGERLTEPDQIGVVLLERVEARPRWRRRTKTWELRVAFSGQFRMAGGVSRPFRDIELPNVILPTPQARVDQLLSNTPLVSAFVRRSGAPGVRFLRAALGATSGGEGEVSLEADLPKVSVETRLVDGTEIEGALDAGPTLRVDGPFTFETRTDESALTLRGMRVGTPEGGLLVDARATVTHDLSDGDRRWDERFATAADVALRKGSVVPAIALRVRAAHPLCVGAAVLPLRVRDLAIEGTGSLSWRGGSLALWPTTRAFRFSGVCATDGPARDERWGQRGQLDVPEARVQGEIELVHGGQWRSHFTADAAFTQRVEVDVPAVPELSIDEGVAVATLSGRARLDGNVALTVPRRNALDIDLHGTAVSVTLDEARVAIGARAIALPVGAAFRATVAQATLRPSGPEEIRVEVGWDLHGRECLLHAGGRSVSLLAPGLRQGQLLVVLEEGGALRFEGAGPGTAQADQEALYGVDYFNALLNPAANPDQLFDLLRSEEALRHVVNALEVFAPDLAETLSDVRTAALTFRTMLDRERITRPADAIPRPVLAKLLSLVLVGNRALVPRLEPIVQRVTEGHGVDIPAMKAILREQLEDLELDYEIDVLVRWLDLLLAPTDPIVRPPVRALLPLVEDPAHAAAIAGIPSAGEIYRAVEEKRVLPGFAAEIADLAPYLSEYQLAWLWKRRSPSWGDDTLLRLRYAWELKQRVTRVRRGYGGVVHAPQAPWIAQFLGEAAGFSAAWAQGGGAPPPEFCALGPEEVAVLLQAGLATGRQSRQTQINNRLLLDLMDRRPPEFTLAVFVELGHQSPRALSGVLFAFLDQDQDQMRRPVDLAGFLERKLGLAVPVQGDYLAGGVRARHCYTEALDQLAAGVLARSDSWLARKAHLQVARHEPRRTPSLAGGAAGRLVKPAKAAIEEADRLSAALSFAKKARRKRGAPTHEEATAAWNAAFAACGELLAAEPLAFRAPWLREFWGRNEEALRVRSVVRGYEEDRDDDRRWLHVRRGDAAPYVPLSDEQALLDAVIDELYVFAEDRQAMKRDPLVRLLVEPPEGRYAFTVVSAMGVITEGARGRELEHAWRRLRDRRGVRLLRADTATARSLEHNAGRVIDEIRRAKTPWGWVGYSQGCANGLMAESILRGGTPDEQRLLDTFVSRNLLFSAANGAAHGTSGDLKLGRAVVKGERYLKPYQATFSRPMHQAFYRAARAALDSRAFHQAMGGWHSLTFERAIAFHRDLQLLERATTSVTRGVCEWPWVPEALEYMWFVLDRLAPGSKQDTQVTIDDADAHSASVDNAWTRAFAETRVPNRVQAIHHWSPLTAEVEFVESERDLDRAIYQSPKDRHVAPWIEVNARFGRIPVAPAE